MALTLHAPRFPLRCEISNNKFDRYQIFDWWREFDKAIDSSKLLCIGHVSDGDSRLRAADFFFMRELQNDKKPGNWLTKRYGLDHEVLDFLKVAVTTEGHKKLGYQDWLHLLWRWRRQFLQRDLHIGPGMHVNWRDLEGAVGGTEHLLEGDLDHSDKQNWGATNRIFSMESVVHLHKQMKSKGDDPNHDPDQHPYQGTLTYILMGYKLKCAWLEDDDPLGAVENAAWVMTALLYWRFWLDERQKNPNNNSTDHYTMGTHNLTRETFLDSIISCSTRILIFLLYRGEEGSDDDVSRRLRQWKPCGNRVSSRFSEYGFQQLRASAVNTPAFGALAATQHLKHYWAHQMIDGMSDFSFPCSRRTPVTQTRPNCVANQRAPDGYWDGLSDAKMNERIDKAVASVKSHFGEELHITGELDLSQQEAFFSSPCLHFPKMDVFKHYISVDMVAPDIAAGADEDHDAEIAGDPVPTCDESEDRPPTDGSRDGDDDGERVDVAVVSEVLDAVIERNHVANDVALSDTEQVKATWQMMCKTISAFNRGHLNKGAMQAHRKFRFIGEKLFNAARNAGAVKDGWHVIHINDDIGIMLEVAVPPAPGSRRRRQEWKKVWRIGNVVDVRVLKADPEKQLSQDQLSNAEVLGYPSQVELDNPKAVLSIRWYHECDNRGSLLVGFQNKECKRKYYLPAFGEEYAEPIVLISNHITIERVEMIKDETSRGIWIANNSHLSCLKKEFKKRK